jgi:hypothetical protein
MCSLCAAARLVVAHGERQLAKMVIGRRRSFHSCGGHAGGFRDGLLFATAFSLPADRDREVQRLLPELRRDERAARRPATRRARRTRRALRVPSIAAATRGHPRYRGCRRRRGCAAARIDSWSFAADEAVCLALPERTSHIDQLKRLYAVVHKAPALAV